MADRGGLFHVKDVVFDFFVAIETIVDTKLSEIMKKCGEGIEQVNKEKLAWVCEDDEVQDLWDVVCSASTREDVRGNLLREIVHMWVTTRGHSKTHMIKEDFKIRKKTAIKGKRALRKELKSAKKNN